MKQLTAARCVVLCVVLLIAACRGGDSKLQERVQGYCSQLRSDLTQAASEYSKLAPELGTATSQPARDRVEALLAIESVGATEQVRWARVRDISNRLQFCARVHQIDDARFSDLQVRSEKLVEQLTAPEALEHPDTTVELLGQFSALLAEVEAVPYLE